MSHCGLAMHSDEDSAPLLWLKGHGRDAPSLVPKMAQQSSNPNRLARSE
jgi:hypothetical protein